MSRQAQIEQLKQVPTLTPHLNFAQSKNHIPMDDSLFAHIHLSRELEGQPDYHGNQSERTTQYAAAVLSQMLGNSHTKESWIKNIDDSVQDLKLAAEEQAAFSRQANQSADALKNYVSNRLSKKSRILMCNRWQTEEGHATLVEIQKLSAERYAIRIINTGEGLEHHPQATGGRQHTVLEYRYSQLGFERTLGELAKCWKELTPEKFYDALKVHHDNIRVAPANASKTMLTGMCSWKMIMAFLKFRLRNKTAYLKAKQIIKAQSLVDYYLLFCEHPSEIRAKHLSLGMQNYARFLRKTNALDTVSVQAGLRLCQQIESVLREKKYLPTIQTSSYPIRILPAQKTAPLPPWSTLSNQAISPKLANEMYLSTASLDAILDTITLPKVAKPTTLPALNAFLGKIRDYIRNDEDVDNAALKAENLHELVTKLPSLRDVCDQISDDVKLSLPEYIKKISSLQTECERFYRDQNENKHLVKPEYILLSAKLCVDMLEALAFYYKASIRFPQMYLDRVNHYCDLLDSIQFYSTNEEITAVWFQCSGALKEWQKKLRSQVVRGEIVEQYDAMRLSILENNYQLNQQALEHRATALLQTCAEEQAQPFSEHNPLSERALSYKLNVKYDFRPYRVQGGKAYYRESYIARVNKLGELVKANLNTIAPPEFLEDAKLLDTAWHFFYVHNGSAYAAVNWTYIPRADYHRQDWIIQRNQDELKIDLSTAPQVQHCLKHDHPVGTCTDVEKQRYTVEEAASPCQVVSQYCELHGGSNTMYCNRHGNICNTTDNYCKQHGKPASECTDADRCIRTVVKYRSPCTSITAYDVPAFNYQYQRDKTFLNIKDWAPLSLPPFVVHPNRSMPNGNDVNADICLEINASVRRRVVSEDVIRLTSAVNTSNMRIESLLQYTLQDFKKLKEADFRDKLLTILLHPNALRELEQSNPQIVQFLVDFLKAYQTYLNLLNKENEQEKHFYHLLTVIFYRHLSAGSQRVLEGFYQSSLSADYGRWTDIYYELQKPCDIQKKIELFSRYHQAIYQMGGSTYLKGQLESRLSLSLRHKILNLYQEIIKDQETVQAGQLEALYREMERWICQIPAYQQARIYHIGYQLKYGVVSLDSLIIKTNLGDLKLNIATGKLSGQLETVPVPQALKTAYPDLLQQVETVQTQEGRYYIERNGIQYCIVPGGGYNQYELYQKFTTGASRDWFKKTNVNQLPIPDKLPNFLRNPQYEYWVKKHEANNVIEWYLIDSSTKTIQYRILHSAQGIAIEKRTTDNWVKLSDNCQSIECFESNYLCEMAENGEKIDFLRYGFSLNRKGAQHVWSKDPTYHLCRIDNTELGNNFFNYLSLESADGKSKRVLIPCQYQIYDDSTRRLCLDTFGLIAADQSLPNGASASRGTLAEQGNIIYHAPKSQSYIECDIDQYGKLTAVNLSDKFYLMYLFLATSHHQRALEIFLEIQQAGYYACDKQILSHYQKLLLGNIPFETKANKNSKQYPKKVLENGKKSALQLKLFTHLLKMHLSNPSEELSNFLDKIDPSEWLTKYEQEINNIPCQMHLRRDELITLFDFMSARQLNTERYLASPFYSKVLASATNAMSDSSIQWRDPVDGGTNFMLDTLFKGKLVGQAIYPEQNGIFNADLFQQETEKQLSLISKRSSTILDEMDWDDRYGQKIRDRADLFSRICQEIVNGHFPHHLERLEHSYLENLERDVHLEQTALLTLVHRYEMTNSPEGLARAADLLGQKRQRTDLNMLVRLFIQHDNAAYRNQLGTLTEAEIQEIDARIANLLRLTTARQYYQRLFPELKKVKEKGDAQGLAALLEQSRAYRMDDPNARYFLAYEYLNGVMIRPAQMKMLAPLLQKAPGSTSYPKYVFQLIMGGGKSKVLMPLSSFLKADGERLAAVVVPEGLFETNLRDLSRTSKETFDQTAVPLRFQRSDAKDPVKLESIRDRLREIIANRDYVVTTKISLQSIELSYLSLLTKENHTSVEQQSILLLEEILTLLQTKSEVFIDEIDSNLDCLSSLNYTLEELQYPPSYLIHLQTQFFRFLCDRHWYQQLITPNLTLDKTTFHAKLTDILWDMMLHPQGMLYQAMQGLSEADKGEIVTYLSAYQDAQRLPRALERCSPEQKRVFGFCRAQFTYILPLILGKEQNVGYGLTQLTEQKDLVEKCLAIPYGGNNNPRETSRFANVYETLGYTTLIHLKTGLPKSVFLKYMAEFKEAYELEMSADNKQRLISELFEQLEVEPGKYPIQAILEKNDIILDQIFHEIKQKHTVILSLLEKFILSKIKLFPYMLESNASDFTSMLSGVQGASGTIDNPGILDPDIAFDKNVSAGTDGKTISILREKAKKEVLKVDSKDPGVYLEQLSATLKASFSDYQAIIDVGAHFSGISNLEVATTIAAFYRHKATSFRYVLYFNEKNLLCGLPIQGGDPIEIGSSDGAVIKTKTGCDPNEYFVYFDQIHTVGTDIPLKKGDKEKGGKAFVHVSPKTNQQALLQGVMRARDLAYSQNVAFVGDKDFKQQDKESVLKLVRDNLLNKIHEDGFRAAKQKLKAIYRRALISKLREMPNLKDKKKLLSDGSQFLFSEMELDPGQLFLKAQSEKETKLLLSEIASNLNKKSERILDSVTRGTLQKQAERIIEHCVKYCHPKTLDMDYDGSRGEMDVNVEAQNEVEQQVEQQAEQQAELEKIIPHDSISSRSVVPVTLAQCLRVSMGQRELIINDFANDATKGRQLCSIESFQLRPGTLFYSKNLLASDSAQQFLGQCASRATYYTLCITSRQGKCMILLSDEDANCIRQEINTRPIPSGYQVSLTLLTGHPADRSTTPIQPALDQGAWEAMRGQMQFLCGNLNQAEDWVWEGNGRWARERIEFYRQSIAPYHSNSEGTLRNFERRIARQQALRQLKEKPMKSALRRKPWSFQEKSYPILKAIDHSKFWKQDRRQSAAALVLPDYPSDLYHTFVPKQIKRIIQIPLIGILAALVLTVGMSLKAWWLGFKTWRLQHRFGLKLSKIPAYQHIEVALTKKPLVNMALKLYRQGLQRYENAKAYFEQQQAQCLYKAEQKPTRQQVILERDKLDTMLQDPSKAIIFPRLEGVLRAESCLEDSCFDEQDSCRFEP